MFTNYRFYSVSVNNLLSDYISFADFINKTNLMQTQMMLQYLSKSAINLLSAVCLLQYFKFHILSFDSRIKFHAFYLYLQRKIHISIF